MIPTTEAEAVAALRKVEDSLGFLKRGMLEVENDSRYSANDREAAATVREFCEVNGNIVNDVISGLAKIFAAKNPATTASIIDALTKR